MLWVLLTLAVAAAAVVWHWVRGAWLAPQRNGLKEVRYRCTDDVCGVSFEGPFTEPGCGGGCDGKAKTRFVPSDPAPLVWHDGMALDKDIGRDVRIRVINASSHPSVTWGVCVNPSGSSTALPTACCSGSGLQSLEIDGSSSGGSVPAGHGGGSNPVTVLSLPTLRRWELQQEAPQAPLWKFDPVPGSAQSVSPAGNRPDFVVLRGVRLWVRGSDKGGCNGGSFLLSAAPLGPYNLAGDVNVTVQDTGVTVEAAPDGYAEPVCIAVPGGVPMCAQGATASS